VTLKGFLIFRPLNVFISSIAVLVALKLSKVTFFSKNGLMSLVVIALLTAFANVSNDYFDFELDRVGHPKRPLVRGDLSLREAMTFSAITALIALLVSLLLGWAALIFTLFLLLLIYFYNRKLKSIPLLGNLTVSFVGACPFLFLWVTTFDIKPLIFPAIFAFTFHMGREIVKDLEDFGADRVFGLRTLPLVLGEAKTLVVATMLLILLIVVSISPFFLKLYGLPYTILVFFGMDIPLLYNLFALIGKRREKEQVDYRKVSRVLKLTIFPALLGLYLGG